MWLGRKAGVVALNPLRLGSVRPMRASLQDWVYLTALFAGKDTQSSLVERAAGAVPRLDPMSGLIPTPPAPQVPISQQTRLYLESALRLGPLSHPRTSLLLCTYVDSRLRSAGVGTEFAGEQASPG